jgi:NAD dependent epimerase/dehydratase family enzyme
MGVRRIWIGHSRRTEIIPRKLLDNGFVFQYPDIRGALQSILGQ